MALWAKFGSEVVGNPDYGHWFGARFYDAFGRTRTRRQASQQLRNDASAPLTIFLRFEQLVGYARVRCHNDTEVRGYPLRANYRDLLSVMKTKILRRPTAVNVDEFDRIIDNAKSTPLGESDSEKLKTAPHELPEKLLP